MAGRSWFRRQKSHDSAVHDLQGMTLAELRPALIEDVHFPRSQTVLGADNQQAVVLDQTLEDG